MLKAKPVAEIAQELGLDMVGGDSIILNGVASIEEAEKGDLTFIRSSKYMKFLETTKASAVIVPKGSDIPELSEKAILLSENAYISFATVLKNYYCPVPQPRGVSPLADVHDSVVLRDAVTIEAGCFIDEGTSIAKGTRVQAGSRIGKNVVIGEDVLICGSVVIEDNCVIGDRVILNPGVVIGGDGFGYTQTEDGNVKLPQIGNVVLGDDVEVGANSTIDRGSLGATVVGKGTKIDNLVQIGHGSRIGEHCVICSQSGIAGSVILGDKVIMASRAGIGDHIKIASKVTIGPMAGVTKDIAEEGVVYSGFPAVPHQDWLKAMGTLAQLPSLRDQFRSFFKK